jgi:hypothetical protein
MSPADDGPRDATTRGEPSVARAALHGERGRRGPRILRQHYVRETEPHVLDVQGGGRLLDQSTAGICGKVLHPDEAQSLGVDGGNA